jgi:competence ComEA-like helix-hairpin-helix protein
VKSFIKEYLTFSKKDRTGIFILLAIILICISLPFVYPYFINSKIYDYTEFDKEIARLKIQQTDSVRDKSNYNKNFDENNYTNYYEPSNKNYYAKPKGEVFYFDPNTASVSDWTRLGVKDRTIQTIKKYLSKGGHFYKPEDIGKIWGLHKNDVERLLPYVRIVDAESPNVGKRQSTSTKNSYPDYPSYKKPSPQIIDINISDTSAFISLPGIGSKLSQRIIAFRSKLGGFYSVDQIKETFGLPDSTFVKIKPQLSVSSSTIKKINLNTATLDEMRSHPYLRYNIANAIIQYRIQHGNFSTVAEIKKIMIITDDIFNKVSPYLTIS